MKGGWPRNTAKWLNPVAQGNEVVASDKGPGNNKAVGVTSRRFVVSKGAVLSSARLAAALSATALLTATLSAATLLTATLLTPALLTATLLVAPAALSIAILFSPLLSSAGRSARLVWILLFVHGAFLVIELHVWLFAHRRRNLFNGIGVESDLD